MCEAGSDCSKKYQEWESNEEIQLFREYLRIPTVHPNVNYGTGNLHGGKGEVGGGTSKAVRLAQITQQAKLNLIRLI